MIFFVGDGAFDDQHERVEFALLGLVQVLHEVVADLVGEHGIVQMNLGQARDRAQDDVLDAGLRRGGDRNRIAIATQACGDPHDMDIAHCGLVAER